MNEITSSKQLQQILNDGFKGTRTFLIPENLIKEVDKVMSSMIPLSERRMMDADEVQELASFLKTDVNQLKGPFWVHKKQICTNCGRKNTFLDFSKTALKISPHTFKMVTDVLTNKAGFILTIPGTVELQKLSCARCDTTNVVYGYGTSTYQCGGELFTDDIKSPQLPPAEKSLPKGCLSIFKSQ